jgi:predicted solute-binding protein
MHAVATAIHSPTHHTAHQATGISAADVQMWLNEIRYRYATGQFKQITRSQIAKYANIVQTSHDVASEHAGMFTSL